MQSSLEGCDCSLAGTPSPIPLDLPLGAFFRDVGRLLRHSGVSFGGHATTSRLRWSFGWWSVSRLIVGACVAAMWRRLVARPSWSHVRPSWLHVRPTVGTSFHFGKPWAWRNRHRRLGSQPKGFPSGRRPPDYPDDSREGGQGFPRRCAALTQGFRLRRAARSACRHYPHGISSSRLMACTRVVYIHITSSST